MVYNQSLPVEALRLQVLESGISPQMDMPARNRLLAVKQVQACSIEV